VLFLLVFLGRGAIPGGMGEVRGELLHIIQTDTDFKTVFAELGRAVDQGESGTEVVTQVWKSVLGLEEDWSPYTFTHRDNPLYLQEVERLSERAGTLHLLDASGAPPVLSEGERTRPPE